MTDTIYIKLLKIKAKLNWGGNPTNQTKNPNSANPFKVKLGIWDLEKVVKTMETAAAHPPTPKKKPSQTCQLLALGTGQVEFVWFSF